MSLQPYACAGTRDGVIACKTLQNQGQIAQTNASYKFVCTDCGRVFEVRY